MAWRTTPRRDRCPRGQRHHQGGYPGQVSTPAPGEPEPGPDPGPGPRPEAAPGPRPASGTVPPSDTVLPEQSREDTDADWGEYPVTNDERLHHDRPPHWDDF